jgi:hypothetical protein
VDANNGGGWWGNLIKVSVPVVLFSLYLVYRKRARLQYSK